MSRDNCAHYSQAPRRTIDPDRLCGQLEEPEPMKHKAEAPGQMTPIFFSDVAQKQLTGANVWHTITS